MVSVFATWAAILLAVAATPAAWGLRAWLLPALPIGTLLLLSPTPRWEDVGPLDGMGQGLALATLALPLAVIVLRSLVASTLGWDDRPIHPLDARARHLVDLALSTFVGFCAGPLLALLLALALRGAPGGLVLHLAVALLALALARLAWHHGPLLARPAIVAALLIVAVAALLGGLRWPAMIGAEAARILPDHPRCLRGPEGPALPSDLMLLTFPRGRPGAPGLVLTVMAPEGPVAFRWSYRANGFVRYHHGASSLGPCPAS